MAPPSASFVADVAAPTGDVVGNADQRSPTATATPTGGLVP
jgi:hypothetical protein